MRRIRNLLIILAVGVLLAGCGHNPYDSGMEQLESGSYAEAARQFQQAIEEEENLADSYRGLGLALWEQEDYEGARDAFLSALEQGSQEGRSTAFWETVSLSWGIRNRRLNILIRVWG